MKLIQKVIHRSRDWLKLVFIYPIRVSFLTLSGLETKTYKLPKLKITWPHKIRIGRRCYLEEDIMFKYDGVWSPGRCIFIGDNVFLGTGCEFNIKYGIDIGSDVLVASGTRFIDHDHGMDPSLLIRTQNCPGSEIKIEKDVWIGCNCIILKGVHIGEGSVIAAGALINKSVPAGEIWGGIPGRRIGERNQRC